MTKEQALYNFWSHFGLKTYDENTVPTDSTFPYITYETAIGSIGDIISLTANLWYLDKSWKAITEKSDEIFDYIGLGGRMIPYDNGAIFITRGTPFAQRMSEDSNTSIRRIVLNIQAEFISA